jgi:hypothetical protein
MQNIDQPIEGTYNCSDELCSAGHAWVGAWQTAARWESNACMQIVTVGIGQVFDRRYNKQEYN